MTTRSRAKTRLLLGAAAFVLTNLIVRSYAAIPPRAESVQLEEVIVRAEKREENLQQVPISLAAVTGEQIQANDLKTAGEAYVETDNIDYDQPYSVALLGESRPARLVVDAAYDPSGSRLK